jgi:peptide/nickel transport system permease protein
MLPPNASGELIEELKRAHGLDRPLPVQYIVWLSKVVTGDFGVSISTGRPVIHEVIGAFKNTLLLVCLAAPIAFLVGTTLGTVAGFTAGSYIDRTAIGVAVTGISIPSYWLALLLIIVFSVYFRILPPAGMGQSGSSEFDILNWQDARYIILPATAMAVGPIGIVARVTRSAVCNVLRQEFVIALRAKGMSQLTVLRHVFKNSLPEILAISGLQLGVMMGGSILVETVFAWPGSGFLLSRAIILRDMPVLQGAILLLSLIFVLINVSVDVIQAQIDPRIRRA